MVGEQTLRIAGTQFDDGPRITRLNDFRVDIQPAGTYLVVTHQDRPGVIAAISTGSRATTSTSPASSWGATVRAATR